MAEAQELQLHIVFKEANSPEDRGVANPQTVVLHESRDYSVWIRIALYTFFVLSGQAVATLLGRLYYDKGGNSKWMATLVQLAGVPVLLPLYLIRRPPNSSKTTSINIQANQQHPSLLTLVSIYASLGLIIAADCFLYSVGLMYLPVSTYSLICSSQLAFNSFFSFFINSQKFTPLIINSLVLLTISATLLVFENEPSNSTEISKVKYVIGFICTVGASAGYGLVLSLTQLVFKIVLKQETFRAIMDMIFYPSFVASCVIVMGLLASKEWMGLKREMEEYELGKVPYVMNLVWTAIAWQVFAIGSVGLILETSSLFSNAISVLGLPIVPVFAVVFFQDKMDGLKVISMGLAIWGFVSFAYQQYLDHCKSNNTNKTAAVISDQAPSNGCQ